MFGELGDSDIYENNRGGGFDTSDNDTNFAFDAQNDANASVSDDFLDTFSDAGYTGNAQTGGQPQPSGILGSNQQQASYNEATAAQSMATSQPQPKKSSGLLYVLILILLFAGAAGMFFYKKYQEQSAATGEQSVGDYFYDKASSNAEGNASGDASPDVNAPQGDMATVDVNLEPGVSKPVEKAKSGEGDKTAADAQKPEKEMSAIEKAMAKKKADEKKESQVGLGNSVVIPVSAGGRPDPFMPYGAQIAAKNKPKFDLVAPPLEVPELDDMTKGMFSIKLSGIMYDDVRPSAIISLGEGNDQLVHKGDIVNGYKVLNITKNSVLIKYNANTYEITAGQSIGENVKLNPVSTISSQFGGAYSSPSGKVIQFNK